MTFTGPLGEVPSTLRASWIEFLISKVLIDSVNSRDEVVLINNVLNEFYNMKEEIKSSNNK